MGLVYLGSLVVALGILALQLALGGKGDHAIDGAGHAGALGHGDGHDHDDGGSNSDAGLLALFLGTRFWVFAALAFGRSGGMIHLFQLAGVVATALIATSAGLGSGLFAALAFRAVKRASLSTTAGASDAIGASGRVLISCGKGRVGEV